MQYYISFDDQYEWTLLLPGHFRINPSNAKATFVQSTTTKFFEIQLNPIMFGIHWIALAGFLLHFISAKLDTSSIRVYTHLYH